MCKHIQTVNNYSTYSIPVSVAAVPPDLYIIMVIMLYQFFKRRAHVPSHGQFLEIQHKLHPALDEVVYIPPSTGYHDTFFKEIFNNYI